MWISGGLTGSRAATARLKDWIRYGFLIIFIISIIKRDGKRPMTFSRYAGPGSHRYPIGFSGDTHITWESLDFQPYFTTTATNIGYGWWSHDTEETYEITEQLLFRYRDDGISITDKADPVTGLAGAKTWIRKGIWYDFFNGRAYKGGRKVDLWRYLWMPVLVREGSIIPLKDMEGYDNSIENPEKLEVLVYPGESGEFVLWGKTVGTHRRPG